MTSCPLCGSPIVYFGLTDIECVGSGCQNSKVPRALTHAEILAKFKRDLEEAMTQGQWVGP